MANVPVNISRTTVLRLGATPSVPPPDSEDNPPINPPGTGGATSHPPLTLGTDQNGLVLDVENQVLELGLASGSQNGALSSTDWNTFNDKIGGSIDSGQVAFGTGSGVIGGENALVWDTVNKRLGIGTNVPVRGLTLAGGFTMGFNLVSGSDASIAFALNNITDFALECRNGTLTGAVRSKIQFLTEQSQVRKSIAFFTTNSTTGTDEGVERWRINSAGDFVGTGIKNINTFSDFLRLQSGGLNVAIGNITPTETLDINGTARIRTINNGTGDILTKSATGVITHRTVGELKDDLNIDSTAYQRDVFTYVATNIFTLTETPIAGLEVFINGQKKTFGIDYTVSGTTLTINTTNVLLSTYTSAEIEAVYYYSTASIVPAPFTGSGTTNRVTRWLGTSQLGVSLIEDNGTNVTLPNTSFSDLLQASVNTNKFVVLDGTQFKFINGTQMVEFLDIQTEIDTGDLVAGTGVILDGTANDRLVGTGNLTLNVSRNVDGGSASTVYLATQSINGGTA